MPYLTTDDDTRLYYESAGSGEALIFVHEFAGDHRSWEPQMRHFARHYHCVSYAARGYPPSDVPDQDRYSQQRARDDIRAVMDALDIQTAHIAGLSMGGFATLHFGFTYPERTRSLVVAGCGYGAQPDQREQFAAEAEATAANIENESMEAFAIKYALGPTRVQFQNADPRGWQEFANQLREHSTEGSARTMRGVQKVRPSLYDLQDEIQRISAPTLVITGDEDWPCLEPAMMLKRLIPTAGLVVMPNAGHTINLEQPTQFNQHVESFLHAVGSQRWPHRDPRAMVSSILGGSDSNS